eukprot:403355702
MLEKGFSNDSTSLQQHLRNSPLNKKEGRNSQIRIIVGGRAGSNKNQGSNFNVSGSMGSRGQGNLNNSFQTPSQRAQHFVENYQSQSSQLISHSYLQLTDMVDKLTDLTDQLMYAHQQDYVAAYKDHMLKVQCELIHLKKKSSDFYQKLKKDERIRFLESTIQWLRGEALSLAKSIQVLKGTNDKLKEQLDQERSERNFLMQYTKSTKKYNTILKSTIDKLSQEEIQQQYKLNHQAMIQSSMSNQAQNQQNLDKERNIISSHIFSIKSPTKSIDFNDQSTLFSNQAQLRASTANESLRRSMRGTNVNTSLDPPPSITITASKNTNYLIKDSFHNRNRKNIVSLSVSSAPHHTIETNSIKEIDLQQQNFPKNNDYLSNQGIESHKIKANQTLSFISEDRTQNKFGFTNFSGSTRTKSIKNEDMVSQLHEQLNQKNQQNQELRNKILKLKKQLDTSQNNSTAFQSQNKEDINGNYLALNSTVDLQELFLECVRSVMTINNLNKNVKQNLNDQKFLKNAALNSQFNHLTQNQKAEVLLTFLNHKQVLKGLYKLVFGAVENKQYGPIMRVTDFEKELISQTQNHTPRVKQQSDNHSRTSSKMNKNQSFLDKLIDINKDQSYNIQKREVSIEKIERGNVKNLIFSKIQPQNENQTMQNNRRPQTQSNQSRKSMKRNFKSISYKVKDGKLVIQ